MKKNPDPHLQLALGMDDDEERELELEMYRNMGGVLTLMAGVFVAATAVASVFLRLQGRNKTSIGL